MMSKNSPEETALLKQAMINSLEVNYGNIQKAAKVVGISPRTHFRWMKEDEQYDMQADISKDVGYRNLKDNLIEMALQKAENGNTSVLNQLIRTFLKYMPDEMKDLNRSNNVPFRAKISYVSTREEAEEIMKQRARNT